MIPKDVNKTKNPLNVFATFEIFILKLNELKFFLRKKTQKILYQLIIIKNNSIII